jgi:hypothetical protein
MAVTARAEAAEAAAEPPLPHTPVAMEEISAAEAVAGAFSLRKAAASVLRGSSQLHIHRAV